MVGVKKSLPAGAANRVMTLQALRAGPMTSMEMTERWSFGAHYAIEMRRAGLVELVEDEYRLTSAGRAACPCRNPLAATAATPPETFTMPKGEICITQAAVLSIIADAGAGGISCAALFDKTEATHKAIANHLTRLTSAGSIERIGRGCYVATDMKNAPKTASTAAEALSGFTLPGGELRVVGGDPGLVAELAEKSTDMHGIPLTVDHHEATDLPAVSLAAQMAQIGGALPAIVEDIRLSDPGTVEFAIYSSGGLDIFSEDCAITLDRDVLAKLRGFLGLFQEAV